jgi:hypothetical protein
MENELIKVQFQFAKKFSWNLKPLNLFNRIIFLSEVIKKVNTMDKRGDMNEDIETIINNFLYKK